ncbi:MAG: LamG-like jellyroll fold domain-containing protein, partial [Chloroflexota bacterium]
MHNQKSDIHTQLTMQNASQQSSSTRTNLFQQVSYTRRRFQSVAIRILLITTLTLTSLPLHAQSTPPDITLPVITTETADISPHALPENIIYRTQIDITHATQWRTLTQMGVTVLDQNISTEGSTATVLVDATQLENLARWHFHPQQTDDLHLLTANNAALRTGSLQPLFAQMGAMASVQAASVTESITVSVSVQNASRANLHTAMQALTLQQRQTLAAAATTDSDDDGVTDTVEGFWCTDVTKADTDFDGTSDADEIAALKAWVKNELPSAPSTSKPFLGWPHQKSDCYDDDSDSVPDLAERMELGLNANRESTDRDKFDDGQELFGNTYCHGSGGFCSYGALPRNEDWGVIFAEMPAWVLAPGNHPLVAAYPVPEVDVVGSSLRVETVTVVTTDHVISEGTEKSYSTAKTQGTSTSKTNTTTWNEYEEFSTTTALVAASFEPNHSSANVLHPLVGGALLTAGTQLVNKAVDSAWDGLGFVTDAACKEVSCKKVISSAVRANIRTSIDGLGAARDGWKRCEYDGVLSRLNCAKNAVVTTWLDTYKDRANAYDADGKTGPTGGQIINYNTNSNEIFAQPVIRIEAPRPSFVPTQTSTRGSSRGGSESHTHTQYEEHTVTNTQAFSSEESWSRATAVDSAHSADLTFTYKIRNVGTEYAREIANLAFNLYIGDDLNPAYTYFVAQDVGGAGKFQNFMPNEEHSYTSRRIPLSLEQMKTIDLGGPVRIVVEDFTYGIDELFYQDASNAGVMVAMEDGTDDGDEHIDTYLIPTWGTETLLNVLTRYFPHDLDDDGNLIAIWTPEDGAVSRCVEPRPVGSRLLCKHALSTAEWWNVYTDGLGNSSSEGFQDTPAASGAVALFRFNQDSDLDGYSDRSERQLGTDADDATSFPRPELLAGLHSIRTGNSRNTGNTVVATLSLLNMGFYDAYGVEAVMVAPDDSITIDGNTVGGSGRVRAQKQVIVGSRLLMPDLDDLPAPWPQEGHAVPAVGGYYTGESDRTYTFGVSCGNSGGCTVGANAVDGSAWTLNWSDGSATGSLDMGSGYASPTFLAVGEHGLTVALYSGTVKQGDSFTVQAQTPRDTFAYTINREPYTEPLVIVSYNDPQGNHRFVLPPAAMQLDAPTTNLQQFAGQMLHNIGVEMVTTAPFRTGNNQTQLVVNNPTATPLTDAQLFLEFINASGQVVHQAHRQTALPSGPTTVTLDWDSGSFSPSYDDEDAYIVLAFLTDHQGNILDTAGRPLATFQADPQPALAVKSADLTWNMGDVTQGTLLKHRFTLANTGMGRLYTYLDTPASGLPLTPTDNATASKQRNRTIGAADDTVYELTLDTSTLAVGAVDQTLTVNTNDPDTPTLSVRILGAIVAASEDEIQGVVHRPLDVPVTISGTHDAGDWVEFTHELAGLYPVKVYSTNYETLHGIGKYATEFGPYVDNIDDGLVGYWSFDDGTAKDSSPHNNHGTVYGGASARAGVQGNALYFDGANDYVLVPNSSSLSSLQQTTITYWTKYYNTISDPDTTISNGEGGDSFFTYAGRTSIGHYLGGWGNAIRVGVPIEASKPFNQQEFIFVTFIASDSIIRTYKNGQQVEETDRKSFSISQSHPWLFGAQKGNFLYYLLHGYLDEIRIYDRVLNDNEIKYLYASVTNPFMVENHGVNQIRLN